MCCKLRLKHRPDIGEVRDVPALGIVVITRFIRVMVLWIVVFFVDRAYQEAYVQNVLPALVRADQAHALNALISYRVNTRLFI